MATTNGGERVELKCRYCSNPEGHNEGCPEPVWQAKTFDPAFKEKYMAEWQRGWARGFSDENPIPYYLLGSYPSAFRYGYCAGKAEINQSVDDAAQANYSYERPLD